MAEMQAIAGHIGGLSTIAAKRADIAVSARRTPTDIDIPALEAEFVALIEGATDA
jgi:beta-N-acetylhexosaminidase